MFFYPFFKYDLKPIIILFFLAACSSPTADNLENAPDLSNCVTAGSKNTTVSVLLVGNSLMNGVQSKIETLLECGGYTANFAISNPGGYWLYQHDVNTSTINLIAQGYNIVLLQEQSGGIGSHTVPYSVINSLKTKIEATGGQMYLYQTWAFSSRNSAVTNSILTGYETIGTYFSAPVIHIGRAWDDLYTNYSEAPPFNLFSDSVHASTHGQSLIAYVLYAYLTGETPVNVSSLTIGDTDALILQTYAWQTYITY